ncbi:cobalamin-binding protein [Stutzerimonas tarimensis]|uniref:Cobalamin-binding protein n=1 Tax=Stutzerimonas tarimensis TaxID=1507735 RepID=A0ABV7T3F6_9GAMM
MKGVGWLFAAALWCGLAHGEPRVVSLAPSMTELMLELGAGELLVGVLEGGEQPASLPDLPSVGNHHSLNIERLVGLRPGLVLLWPDSIGAAQREQLRRFGIPLYEARPRTLDDLADQAEVLGRLIGREATGAALANEVRGRLALLRERYRGGEPLRVFYQVWDAPLYTLGGRQVINDALGACGAVNLFADLQLAAPQVSLEAVLARDPDVILASDPSLVPGWSAWPQLKAVRQELVFAIPDRGLERPSLQMLGATERLCQLLHDE